jgi:glyoxylase-like metal-dependent hydrolase (beta-lactamase superfamily II)
LTPKDLPQDLVFFERGWLSSNTVLLRGDDPVVIDSGHTSHAKLLASLIQHRLGPQAPTKLINTHLHSDHCGGNAHLLDIWPQLDTWVPQRVLNATNMWDEHRLTFADLGQHCPRFKAQSPLEAGQTLLLNKRVWEIHDGPGHDADSVLLFAPHERILISADALWENGFGVLFDALQNLSGFDQQEKTLDLIESLNPQWVLPGHGGPFNDIKSAITRARGRLAHWRHEPQSHAQHAAHVLIKFHLMVRQSIAVAHLLQWAQEVRLLQRIHQDFHGEDTFDTWFMHRIESLCLKKALRMKQGHVIDV